MTSDDGLMELLRGQTVLYRDDEFLIAAGERESEVVIQAYYHDEEDDDWLPAKPYEYTGDVLQRILKTWAKDGTSMDLRGSL